MLRRYAKNLMDRQLNQPIQAAEETSTSAPVAYEEDKRTPLTESSLPSSESFSNLSKTIETKISHYDEPETVVGEKVSIKGTLSFERHLRIDGSFEGDLISEGKIVIGPKGSVKADINLSEAFISGTVEGNICVKKRLVLRGRAVIRGDIKAASLSVDEGVSIVGKVEVIPATSSEDEEF